MHMKESIHSSILPSIHPSSSIHPSIIHHPLIHLSYIYSSIDPSIFYSSIIHPAIIFHHPSIHPFIIHLFIHSSIHLLSIHHSSIFYPFIHPLSIHSSIRPLTTGILKAFAVGPWHTLPLLSMKPVTQGSHPPWNHSCLRPRLPLVPGVSLTYNTH